MTGCHECGAQLGHAHELHCSMHCCPLSERLRKAILDIDAHATPLGEDADGFVTGGYTVSVGSLHRALGAVGHGSAPCSERWPCAASAELAREVERLREENTRLREEPARKAG